MHSSMLRVRATTAIAVGYSVVNPGQEFELPNDDAVALLRSGAVERVESVPETAVAVSRGEKAVRSVRPVR